MIKEEKFNKNFKEISNIFSKYKGNELRKEIENMSRKIEISFATKIENMGIEKGRQEGIK